MRADLTRGSLAVVRVHWRTAWPSLLAWPLGLALMIIATGRGIVALYPTLADRVQYAGTAGFSPGAVALNGRWGDLETLGGITTNEVGFLGLLLLPIAGIHLGVARTRREEDSGRTELLTAGVIGRLAPVLGAALAAALAVAGFGLLTGVGLWAVGLPGAGSARYAGLEALFVLAWLGLGLTCAEVSRDARTAQGLGYALVLAVYLTRTAVDAAGWRLPWSTPMAWLPEAAPYGQSAWWPYAALGSLALTGLLVASVVHLRRDLGGGLLAPRPGPRRGAARLGTPHGYAVRLTRGMAAAWLVGLVAWGAALGALTEEMAGFADANPQLLAILGVDRAEDLVIAMASIVAGLGVSAMALQGVGRLAAEEVSGRLGLVLAGRATPRRVSMVWTGVLIGQATVVILCQAVAFGVAAAAVTGEWGSLTSSLRAALVLAVPVLLVLSIGLAALVVRPRLIVAGWLVVGWGAVVAFLAQALDLPSWARDLSPFAAVGQVPVEDARGWVVAGVAAAAAGCMAGASIMIGRRDLIHG